MPERLPQILKVETFDRGNFQAELKSFTWCMGQTTFLYGHPL